MDFAPICPSRMLNLCLTKRNTWFALAQEDNPVYEKFYRDRPADVTLILDNGAYEGQLTVSRYTNKIYDYKPEVTVLPDILCGPWKRSMQLGLGFLDTLDVATEWMYVPQAEAGDLKGWTESLLWGANDERVSWIGLPRCLCTHISGNSLARVFWADYIREKFPHLKVHALGMINGNEHELPYLAERGVRSIDSSSPFNVDNLPRWEARLEAIDQCLTPRTL